MWPMIAMAAISAISQARAAADKQTQQRSANMAAAETTRYSPWTGMKGQLDTSYAPSQLSGAIGGGIQGMAMAQSMKNSGMFGDNQNGSTSWTGNNPYNTNYYGQNNRMQA